MSRTGKDIQSRVHIAIVDAIAITAYPLPYSKVCDTVRPRIGKASTIRADLGGKALIDFLVPRAMPNGLVREHCTEARPRSIENRLGHPGSGQSCGSDVADRNKVKLPHDAVREFVQEIPAGISDLGVNLGGQAFLACSLRVRQLLLKASIPAGVVDRLACREDGKVFQPQINADAALRWSGSWLGNFDHYVQEPVTASIAAEVRSIFDLAWRKRARMEHSEGVACKTKGFAFTLEVTALQWHPCKRISSAIAQVCSTVLRPRVGVLLAHGVNSSRVQPQLFATPDRQPIEVKPTRPTFIPFKRVPLGIVAVVPHIVDRAALLVQHAMQGFHSIAVNQDHCIIIQEQRFLFDMNVGALTLDIG
jgi:hypothetical protein